MRKLERRSGFRFVVHSPTMHSKQGVMSAIYGLVLLSARNQCAPGGRCRLLGHFCPAFLLLKR
jgi:hypothetical protein